MTNKPGCSSWKKPEKGAAVIELALLAPVLIGLALGLADYGRVMYASILVKNAARAGAQYALDYRYTDDVGIKNAAVQDVGGHLAGFNTSKVTVATTCGCPGVDPPPGTLACSLPTPTCATGSPYAYVSVTTAYTFTTLTNYPGFPHAVPLTGTAIIRAQ